VRLNAVLFYRDLRVDDQPALQAAISDGRPLFCLYCLPAKEDNYGMIDQRWLPGALGRLSAALAKNNLILYIFRGDIKTAFSRIMAAENLTLAGVYCSSPTSAQEAEQKKFLSEMLEVENAVCHFFESTRLHPASLLLMTAQGTPFRVFKPFFKSFCQCLGDKNLAPEEFYCPPVKKELCFSDLPEGFIPFSGTIFPASDKVFSDFWCNYGDSAEAVLDGFLSDRLLHYDRFRNYFGLGDSSMLSPYLAWGEISVRRIVQTLGGVEEMQQNFPEFWRQLVWREFAAATFHHNPQMPDQALSSRWPAQEPTTVEELRSAWQSGNTGFPLIDAGMRQLDAVGWMPNRVRMVVASFLVKNLLQSWSFGASVFMKKLVDADPANNYFGWQWCAGCGYDAAPFFRIFNPERQLQEYDPQLNYVKTWCDKTREELSPVIDYALSRKRALEYYASRR
jgi:deoxyribodipyrimidine photo-lyase